MYDRDLLISLVRTMYVHTYISAPDALQTHVEEDREHNRAFGIDPKWGRKIRIFTAPATFGGSAISGL